MSAEQKSPVEQFNAQLDNAILEYNKTGRGKITLDSNGFYGMISQFLNDPTGATRAAGIEAEKTAGLLKIRSGEVKPLIGRNEKGVAIAQVGIKDVNVAVGDLLQLGAQEIFVQLAQSARKPHQVELSSLKIIPDIPINKLNLPIPVPGNMGQIAFEALGGEHFMAGLYDSVSGLVLAKKVESKPKRIEVDILPEEGLVNVVLIKVGLNPNYPASIQYGVLKRVIEELAKQ